MKKQDENAKDPRWKVPVDLPHVEPEDYDESKGSTYGSTDTPEPEIIRRDEKDIPNPAKEEQKKRGQYPLHDEEIGGG